MNKFSVSLMLLLSGFAVAADAELVVNVRASVAAGNGYQDYYADVIRLALEKTKPKYGSYQIDFLPEWSWFHERVLAAAIRNEYTNILVEVSYDPALTKNNSLSYVPIPVDGGMFGYRVCFVNPAIADEVERAKSVSDLLRFSHAQGVGWADTSILRDNGFKVTEIGNYTSIYKMLVAGRVDFFCRGISQIKPEYDLNKEELPALIYNRSFIFYYPLPRYFYLNKRNLEAKNRLTEGLSLAFKDGSLERLWRKHNQENVDYLNLKNRKVFVLKNPLLENFPDDYKRYFFPPTVDQ